MSIIGEFKKFAIRGNVIDLAVGIIIGGGFNQVVSSLVNDIIMPPVGDLLGKVDFSNLYVNLSGTEYPTLAAAKAAGAAVVSYGQFLNAVVSFLITAFAVFLLVKFINRVREAEEKPSAPATKPCPYCLTTVPEAATRCLACTSDLGAARS